MPEAGDVLVKRLPRRPPVYALSVVPNLSQITFDTYVQAIAHADRFARRQGVAVWTIEP